jgi:predicted membrane-bound mannosyltransferase
MRMDHESPLTSRWIVFGTAVVYFALGSLLTAHFMQLKEAWSDSHHVLQLEIYHPVPGKAQALAERCRSASRLQARRALVSQQEAKALRDGFDANPAFEEYVQSEKAEQLIQGVDATFMPPTDDSVIK